MKTVLRYVAPLLLLVMTCAPLDALTIDVGDIQLLPDTPGQAVQFDVTGGELVEGLNFYLQVADGGPDAGGTVVGPSITSVDLLTRTIFESNSTGQNDPGSVPQVAARTTTTASGTVAATGVLATVFFDTSGLTMGTWALSMANTLNGPTDFAGVQSFITDGTVTIVPETSFALFGLSGVVLLRKKRRIRSGTFRATEILAE